MEADLHIHTNRYCGCSNIDPAAASRRANQVGLGAIALTEHGIRWPDDQIAQLLKISGVKDIPVLPGQELACYSRSGAFQGEFLVFGYPVGLGSNNSIQRVLELVHGESGVGDSGSPVQETGAWEGFLRKWPFHW